jgi:hypothetical protein
VRSHLGNTMVPSRLEISKKFQQTTEFDGEISPTIFWPDLCEFRPQIFAAILPAILGRKRVRQHVLT